MKTTAFWKLLAVCFLIALAAPACRNEPQPPPTGTAAPEKAEMIAGQAVKVSLGNISNTLSDGSVLIVKVMLDLPAMQMKPKFRELRGRLITEVKTLLAGRDAAEMATDAGREKLKLEIKTIVARELGEAAAETVAVQFKEAKKPSTKE